MAKPASPSGALSAFPSLEEGLALQASLLDGDAAIEAWRKISNFPGPEQGGIAWITPLLMANVSRLLPDDPWVLTNPHFLTLSDLKSRGVAQFAERILRALEESAIPTMALKGLALGASVYASPGLRVVSDLDILVPRRDLRRAIHVLKNTGLRAASGEPKTAADLRNRHAQVFHSERRHDPAIDLHWHVLASARHDDDDDRFWSGAEPLTIGGAPTRKLCPEHQLLHALVHGVRWTRMPHVRWVADATLILRAAGRSFREERFVESAVALDAVTPARHGLRYVVDLLGEGRELLERLKALPPSRFAERAFKARSTSYENRSVADRIALRVETAFWSWRAGRQSVPREQRREG